MRVRTTRAVLDTDWDESTAKAMAASLRQPPAKRRKTAAAAGGGEKEGVAAEEGGEEAEEADEADLFAEAEEEQEAEAVEEAEEEEEEGKVKATARKGKTKSSRGKDVNAAGKPLAKLPTMQPALIQAFVAARIAIDDYFENTGNGYTRCL